MACFALSCTDLESSMTIKMEDEFGVSLWHFRLITMCPAKMAAKNGNFRSNLWQAHSTALSRNQHNFKVCPWKDKTTSLLLHGHTRTYSDTVFELGKVLVMLWTKSKFVFYGIRGHLPCLCVQSCLAFIWSLQWAADKNMFLHHFMTFWFWTKFLAFCHQHWRRTNTQSANGALNLRQNQFS